MTTIEIQSLYEVLNKLMVSEIPEPLKEDEKDIWIKGIALVEKNDCSKNYAIVKNDGYGNPAILEDFGRSAIITHIGEVHPTHWLRGEDMPVLRNKTDMISYLSNHGESKDKVKSMLNEKGKSKKEIESNRNDVMALIINHAEEDIENKILNKERENEIYEESVKEAERGIEK